MGKNVEIVALQEFLSMFESAGTSMVYRADIIEFFKIFKKKPENVNKLDVVRYLESMKKRKLSSSTINRKFSALRSYYNFLVGADVLTKNPFLGKELKLPKIKHPEKVYLTEDERSRVVEALKGNTITACRKRAVVYLMLYNGMRRGEICKFTFRDILSGENGERAINIHGKGNKDRIRPIHPEAWKAIQEYLKTEKRGEVKKSDSVFLNKYGNPLTPSNIYDIVETLCKRAKIDKKISPHVFRSTFTSMALEQGVPITSVQYDLGHSSPETTALYDRSKRALSRSSVHSIKAIKPPGKSVKVGGKVKVTVKRKKKPRRKKKR